MDKQKFRQQCSLIIVAAGKGTRLGFGFPKTLYKLGGKTIVERIIDTFSPYCAHVVLVVSPSGFPNVQDHLKDRKGICFTIQSSPLGMADAVSVGLEACRTPYVCCVWGDQPFFPLGCIEHCLKTLIASQPSLVLPVCRRKKAYIHIEKEPSTGNIRKILQAREGDCIPEYGVTDCSVFFFRTEEIANRLRNALTTEQLRGRLTHELNFLPIIPLLDRTILTQIEEKYYCPGINTPEDAKIVEDMLNEWDTYTQTRGSQE